MKKLKLVFLTLLTCFIFISCHKDQDDLPVTNTEINDFVWKGMNTFYLYKDNVPDLADNRFSNSNGYTNYLNSFNRPEDLFESLIYERSTVDKFSWIVSNYFLLEQMFEGTTGTNGMNFNLYYAPNSETELIGVITYILPNSPADNGDLKRGDVFFAINGETLTVNNYNSLLSQDSYTINLGVFNDKNTADTSDDSIDATGENISLSKVVYTEDPIFKTKIIDIGGNKAGYLMYNKFTSGSENQLNTVFGEFKSSNIQYLILDLRYNPGGSVSTETYLASMITGQFSGEVFAKLIYNENLEFANKDYTFQSQLGDGSIINSLNLNKLYVLTTTGSASASEGLINGLNPYINVIQIGTNTTGKTQASITLYDSPDFRREFANPGHTYAMQPLVAKAVNKNNVAVPSNGLTPTIGFEYEETFVNYGILGDKNEPMLAIALADIEGTSAKSSENNSKNSFKPIENRNDLNRFNGGMIID